MSSLEQPRECSTGSKTRSLSHSTPNSQSQKLQSQEQEQPDQAGGLSRYAPRNFHELVYGILVLMCVIEAMLTRNGNMLLALWAAAATQIGIPVAQQILEQILSQVLKRQKGDKKSIPHSDSE